MFEKISIYYSQKHRTAHCCPATRPCFLRSVRRRWRLLAPKSLKCDAPSAEARCLFSAQSLTSYSHRLLPRQIYRVYYCLCCDRRTSCTRKWRAPASFRTINLSRKGHRAPRCEYQRIVHGEIDGLLQIPVVVILRPQLQDGREYSSPVWHPMVRISESGDQNKSFTYVQVSGLIKIKACGFKNRKKIPTHSNFVRLEGERERPVLQAVLLEKHDDVLVSCTLRRSDQAPGRFPRQLFLQTADKFARVLQNPFSTEYF